MTEVKKALPPGKYCSILPLMVFKSPWSKNLEEFKTEIVFETKYYCSTKLVTIPWRGAEQPLPSMF